MVACINSDFRKATGSTSETRKGLTVPFGHNIPRGLVRAKKKEDVMSETYQRLAHSSWDFKYHVVFVPKARQKECQIIEGHLLPDHVHMCIAIPPKYPVASVIGFLKGKSAIAMARLCGKERNFTGEHFWARGYAVSTVGFELEQVRKYIREQEVADGNSGSF